jgi:succinate dehydrogenase/fumarate reductase flavoprotein subunit
MEDTTDVLVIGSGLAGLRAAIEAKKALVDVILIDKSFLGRGSASIYAGSVGSGVVLDEPPGGHEKALEHTFELMVREGVDPGWDTPYLQNQRLMMAIAVDATGRQAELRDYGVKDPYGQEWYAQRPLVGRQIIMPLVDSVKRMGVRIFVKTTMFDLIKKGDRIVGAVGFDVDTGEFIIIKAKATVLATGGCQRIFKRTHAPYRLTGDGYAMAYRGGASLWDMELSAIDLVGLDEPNLPHTWLNPSSARYKGIYRNAQGEPFVLKYLKEHNLLGPNATLSLDDPQLKRYGIPGFFEMIAMLTHFWTAAMKEIHEGRGDKGCIYLDLTRNTDEEWFKSGGGVQGLNLLRDFDWKHKWVHIQPLIVGQIGGVEIDEDGRTSVKGLYAAGEVAEGHAMHHANVTGARTGRSAAIDATFISEEPKLGPKECAWIEDKKRMLQEILDRKPTSEGDPKEIKRLIGEIMWQYAGPLKSGDGLNTGLKELEKIRKENLPKLYAKSPLQLRGAIEVINMVLVGELVARSALHRTETRGSFQRIDYPRRDDKNWLKNVLVKEEDGKMKVYTQAVELIWARPKPKEGEREY